MRRCVLWRSLLDKMEPVYVACDGCNQDCLVDDVTKWYGECEGMYCDACYEYRDSKRSFIF